jgi:pimeloyl-ACP methyl ester carboxylesterase
LAFAEQSVIAAVLAIGLSVSLTAAPQRLPDTTLQFSTFDDVTVWGDLYLSDAAPQSVDRTPILLLFHQGGGDARGEYGPLVPRLLERGYHAFAIDQRRGGERFGSVNRTAAALSEADYTYCDAYADVEGALGLVRERGFLGPIVAWGSSYSGTLALKLAAEHPDEVAAVIAFSPAASAMDGCEDATFAPHVRSPVLVLRPVSEMELESVRIQLERLKELGFETYVADPGVHGSSMLSETRVRGSTERTWAVVLDFLDRALDRALDQPGSPP